MKNKIKISDFLINYSDLFKKKFLNYYLNYYELDLKNKEELLELIIEFKKIKKIKKIVKKDLSNKDTTFLLSKKRIYNVDLKIKKGVFVPQYDTEILIEEILKNKKNFKNGLEVGVGTGVISISIIKNSNIKMTGIDLSKKAIKLTKKNLLKNDINNNENIFFKKNILNFSPKKKYDFIISNPPYIDKKNEINDVEKWVKKNQPKKSLYAKENGHFYYKYLINNWIKYINPGGYIFFEIGHKQQELLFKLIKDNLDVENFYFVKDYSNNYRCLVIKFKGKK